VPTVVQRQIVLPWGHVLKIAFNSIRVRLFRSSITTLTLTLAIAFVAYTWFTYDILNSLWHHANPSLQQHVLDNGFELSHGKFGSSPKDRWLAILSLLVCVIGIVNAQLMAVTERFREIGTFKCLGALNSFVVRIFLVEAVYQGLFGGITGGILGISVSALSLAVKLGWVVILYCPGLEMLYTFAWASALAVILSLLGVTYPAMVAARMQPAVALRTEE
jgi:putative ABC transport system permease protein